MLALFENPPVKPARRRRKPLQEDYKYIRRVKGLAWQARMWLGTKAGGSLNLGLFTTAEHPADPDRPRDEMAKWAAARASREFNKFFNPLNPDRNLRATLKHLKAKKFIPQDVLPPRVRRAKGGGYVAWARKGNVRIEADGTFGCPWAAYEALCEAIRTAFPRGQSKSAVREYERKQRRKRREEKAARRYRKGTLTDWFRGGADRQPQPELSPHA
ncbi:MAG TPA: hypothetical protein VGE74_09655 [Gemmata sp.]